MRLHLLCGDCSNGGGGDCGGGDRGGNRSGDRDGARDSDRDGDRDGDCKRASIDGRRRELPSSALSANFESPLASLRAHAAVCRDHQQLDDFAVAFAINGARVQKSRACRTPIKTVCTAHFCFLNNRRAIQGARARA